MGFVVWCKLGKAVVHRTIKLNYQEGYELISTKISNEQKTSRPNVRVVMIRNITIRTFGHILKDFVGR